MTAYAPIMLAAGLGIPVLAALNASLGARLDSPILAAAILFGIALMATLPLLAFFPAPRPIAVDTLPGHLFLGGLIIAAYVLSITHIAPKIGVGQAVFLVVLGQIISAAAIDQFGLLGARLSPLTPDRAAGILLLIAGLWLTQQAS